MKIKTSELTGKALDWAVLSLEDLLLPDLYRFSPSCNWAQGGPIIEREKMQVYLYVGGTWSAKIRHEAPHPVITGWSHGAGETLLIAAMRCYINSRLGDEIDVPDELMGE